MASPADQRLMELLDKWLSSLDLHLKYSSLDDREYHKIQPWVEHQRPNRWIVELARQKTLTLRGEAQKRIDANDEGFCEALELMGFLANLVGSQNIERFIPMAESAAEREITVEARVLSQAGADASTAGDAATREMPGFLGTHAKSTHKAAARTSTRLDADSPPPIADRTRDLVLEDAVRLMQWGRKWFELAELISRLADRPSLPEVRIILKDQKQTIEKLARA